jgi:hypothetical protein
MAEQSQSPGGSNGTIRLSVTGWLASERAGYFTPGLTVLRGTASNTYIDRYDLLPNSLFWSALTGITQVDDTGTSIVLGDTSDIGTQGYPTNTYPVNVGSSDALLYDAVDQSGFEPNNDYSILIFDQSWSSPYHISSKTIKGFRVDFDVSAPSGGGTFSWMLVRGG